MNIVSVQRNGKSYQADMARASDLSITVDFNESSLQAFGAPAAYANALTVDSFVGNVHSGGSCNCSTVHFTPHCNGTHTECVGHITRDRMDVNGVAPTTLLFAALISVTPTTTASGFAGDKIITRELLQQAIDHTRAYQAIIVRTLPNDGKRNASYGQHCPAYFSDEALAWLADIGVDHLLVDLPSVDRMADNGLLLAHRAFWGMPRGSTSIAAATRSHATITELIYVPDTTIDNDYILNLQVAPLTGDAAPSRPLLYPLIKS